MHRGCNIAILQEWIKKNGPWNKGMSIKKVHTCLFCKKIFYIYESSHRTYCSKLCSFKDGVDGCFSKQGELHPSWKGDKAGYKALHGRVVKLKGKPKFCEVCKTTDENKIYEWANLTGHYLDVLDYKRMCNFCHRKYDRKRKKLYGKQFSSHSAR